MYHQQKLNPNRKMNDRLAHLPQVCFDKWIWKSNDQVITHTFLDGSVKPGLSVTSFSHQLTFFKTLADRVMNDPYFCSSLAVSERGKLIGPPHFDIDLFVPKTDISTSAYTSHEVYYKIIEDHVLPMFRDRFPNVYERDESKAMGGQVPPFLCICFPKKKHAHEFVKKKGVEGAKFGCHVRVLQFPTENGSPRMGTGLYVTVDMMLYLFFGLEALFASRGRSGVAFV